MINYSLILSTNYVGKQWSMLGNDYDAIEWLDVSTKPTKAELDELWASTQAVAANQQAIANRHNAYVAEADPLFFKAQRGEGNMADWEAKVIEIKNRYPKV